MEIYPRITIKPGRCGGKPCIRGYHVTVEQLLAQMARGATRADLCTDWDFLTDADIDAALAFGSHLASKNPLPAPDDFDFVN